MLKCILLWACLLVACHCLPAKAQIVDPTYDYVWTNHNGGAWNEASNWSPNGVPGSDLHASHSVWITNAGDYTVTMNDGLPRYLTNLVMGGAATGTQTLVLAAGSLTVRQALEICSGGVFTNTTTLFMDGSITVATNGIFCLNASQFGNAMTGTNTLSGSALWLSGSIQGRTDVVTNGVLTLDSANSKFLYGMLVNHGVVRWLDGYYFILRGDSPCFLNDTNGWFEILGDDGFFSDYSTDPRLENRGVIRKSGSGAASISQVNFTNAPGARIESGGGGVLTMSFANGSYRGSFEGAHLVVAPDSSIHFGGGVVGIDYDTHGEGDGTIAVTGYVEFSGGVALTNLTVLGNGTVVGNNYFYPGARVTLNSQGGLGYDASSQIRFDGQLTWIRGGLKGQVTFAAPATVIVETNGGWNHYLDGTVTNYGDFVVKDTLTVNGSLVNQPSGVVTVPTSGWISGNGSVQNTGHFIKRTDPGDLYVSPAFTNLPPGRVQVKAGRLLFNGGGRADGRYETESGATTAFSGSSWTFAPSTEITGTPARLIYSLTIDGMLATTNLVLSGTLGGDKTITVPFSIESGGALAGTNRLTSTLDWRGGYISGPSEISASGFLQISGDSDHYLNGMLTNHGRILWQDSGQLNCGADLVNADDGEFEIALTNSAYVTGAGRWINFGRIRKTDTNHLVFYPVWENVGELELQRGVMSFNNGSLVLEESSLLSFPLSGAIPGATHGQLHSYGMDLRGAVAIFPTNDFTPALLQTFTSILTSSGSLTNSLASSNVQHYATNRYLHLGLFSSQNYTYNDRFVATVHSVPVALPLHVTVLEDHDVMVDVAPYCSTEDGGFLALTDTHFSCAHGSTGLPIEEVLPLFNKRTQYSPFWNYFGPDQFVYEIADMQGVTVTNTVFITVMAVDDPPLADVSDKWFTAGRRYGFQMTAIDPDSDAPVTFSLQNGAPESLILSPEGWLAWQPPVAFQNTTNRITIITTDGTAAGTNSFTIYVQAPRPTCLKLQPDDAGGWQIGVAGESELDHYLQFSTNLVDWTTIRTNLRAVSPYTNALPSMPGHSRVFYRLRLGP